jgi:hypothetical protein
VPHFIILRFSRNVFQIILFPQLIDKVSRKKHRSKLAYKIGEQGSITIQNLCVYVYLALLCVVHILRFIKQLQVSISCISLSAVTFSN